MLPHFFNCPLPHKDKLVLHCFNDILMDFLSRSENLCHKNFGN